MGRGRKSDKPKDVLAEERREREDRAKHKELFLKMARDGRSYRGLELAQLREILLTVKEAIEKRKPEAIAELEAKQAAIAKELEELKGT